MVPTLDPFVHDRLTMRLREVADLGGASMREPLLKMLGRPDSLWRPALLYTVASCGRQVDASAALDCATAVELLHLSTLVHNDFIDETNARGRHFPRSSHNGVVAVLGGTLIAAAGGTAIARAGVTASTVWHQTFLKMCRGKATEEASRFRVPDLGSRIAIMEQKRLLWSAPPAGWGLGAA